MSQIQVEMGPVPYLPSVFRWQWSKDGDQYATRATLLVMMALIDENQPVIDLALECLMKPTKTRMAACERAERVMADKYIDSVRIHHFSRGITHWEVVGNGAVVRLRTDGSHMWFTRDSSGSRVELNPIREGVA